MSDTKNVKLGVCQVFFDGADLGYTQGGVEVAVTTESHEVMVDQFGKTAINEYIQGRKATASVPLVETTLRNLVAIMPGASLYSDGAQATGVLTFSAIPSASTTVTIGGQAFTFQTTASTSVYQVKIGTSIASSIENLVNAVNSAPAVALALGGVTAFNGAITVVKGVVVLGSVGTVMTLRAQLVGSAANAITTVASGTTPPVFGGATMTLGVNETKARVDVDTATGVDMLSICKVLRLHPINKIATDFSDDFTFSRAATLGALQFAYKTDAERVYNVEFRGYPDPLTGKLFSVGDLLAV
jgi:hypothetical protein